MLTAGFTPGAPRTAGVSSPRPLRPSSPENQANGQALLQRRVLSQLGESGDDESSQGKHAQPNQGDATRRVEHAAAWSVGPWGGNRAWPWRMPRNTACACSLGNASRQCKPCSGFLTDTRQPRTSFFSPCSTLPLPRARVRAQRAPTASRGCSGLLQQNKIIPDTLMNVALS